MTTPQKPPSDTLDLLFQITPASTERQIEAGERHDDKATKLAGAASVILGFLALSPNSCRELTIAALVAYSAALGGALFCMWPRKYSAIRHGEVLWNEFWDATPHEIKHAIVHRSAQDYIDNKRLLSRKIGGVFVALGATALEAVLVGLQVAV